MQVYVFVDFYVGAELLGNKIGLGSSCNDTKQYHSKVSFTKVPLHQQYATGLAAFLLILAWYCLFHFSYSGGWVLISHCAAF